MTAPDECEGTKEHVCFHTRFFLSLLISEAGTVQSVKLKTWHLPLISFLLSKPFQVLSALPLKYILNPSLYLHNHHLGLAISLALPLIFLPNSILSSLFPTKQPERCLQNANQMWTHTHTHAPSSNPPMGFHQAWHKTQTFTTAKCPKMIWPQFLPPFVSFSLRSGH